MMNEEQCISGYWPWSKPTGLSYNSATQCFGPYLPHLLNCHDDIPKASNFEVEAFPGQMPFLLPNQLRQSKYSGFTGLIFLRPIIYYSVKKTSHTLFLHHVMLTSWCSSSDTSSILTLKIYVINFYKFAWLCWNSIAVAMTVPGDPDMKWFFTRMKIWQTETEVCHGHWVRFICNLGIGDIVRITSAQQLFVNKIRLEQDPVAFRCLELWYHSRLRVSSNDKVFNATFYANLPFATNHV